MEGKSVYAKVTGFTPYFYISLPDEWEKLSSSKITEKLEKMEAWLVSKENRKVYYQYRETLLEITFMKKKKTDGFTYDPETQDYKEFNFARLVFNNSIGMKKFSYLFENNELVIPGVTTKPTKFKLYESNMMPMLRCFHIRKISGCSWVSTSNYKKVSKEEKKESRCDIEIKVDWQELAPMKKDRNAPFIIASFDIECFSHDGQFPQASRKKDVITQIGITYTKLGESLPYRKWIACLEQTDDIPDVEVVSCETENQVIEAWIDELNKYDSDIITGYNIFHFDENLISFILTAKILTSV
jgi:DNA polymerase delta subunit 1